MSERRRFLGGAAAGLFLAVAIVAAVNLGIAPVASSTGQSLMVKTLTTSSSSSSSTSTFASLAVPSNTSNEGGGAALSTTMTETATSAQSSSATQAPPIQTSTPLGTASGKISTGGGLSTASIVQTLPAVAIALILGVMVYQLSIRRVESG
jgi:hypothetical protein